MKIFSGVLCGALGLERVSLSHFAPVCPRGLVAAPCPSVLKELSVQELFCMPQEHSLPWPQEPGTMWASVVQAVCAHLL